MMHFVGDEKGALEALDKSARWRVVAKKGESKNDAEERDQYLSELATEFAARIRSGKPLPRSAGD